tara:strand:+ start:247 stop:414 length:168 start_codon:yes stop_codon:yes gene_type:complete
MTDKLNNQVNSVHQQSDNLARAAKALSEVIRQMQEDSKRRAKIFSGELDKELGIK